MKKFLNIMILTVVAISLTFVSCDSNDSVLTPEVDNELSGSVSGNKVLDPTVEYKLVGPLIVEDGGVLDIPAGTVIKSEPGFSRYILVLQGGKINILGTKDKPVIIKADKEDAGEGYWGGIVINGKAPLADPNEVGSTEINSAYVYGGNVSNDNSGIISYLELGNTGARSSADVEHNGLTLNGVGSGTQINNLYIYDGADDAIEFFGGSVNVTNLLVVNSDDDMFDFTQGYNGTLKNAYGIWKLGYQSSESDPRGIEADGNLDGNYGNHPNQSNFRVENMTIDLKLAAVSGDEVTRTAPPYKYMHDVIKLRRGANATIVNALVKGTGTVKDLIDLSDGKGVGNTNAQISLTNALNNVIIGNEITVPSGQTPADYPGVKVEAGNSGCPTNIFDWTGYQF